MFNEGYRSSFLDDEILSTGGGHGEIGARLNENTDDTKVAAETTVKFNEDPTFFERSLGSIMPSVDTFG